MKKIAIVISLLVMVMLFSSCFWEKDSSVDEAKKNMGIKEVQNKPVVLETNTEPVEMVKEEEKEAKPKVKKFEVKELTDEQYIKIDDLDLSKLMDKQVEITWKTLKHVDKIVVNFKNEKSSFPEDSYKLWKYKAGDDTFLYRAFEKYETIDDGINLYTIEAHSGDNVSRTQVILRVVEDEDEIVEEVSEEASNTEDSSSTISLTDLPMAEEFWKMEKADDWTITYSTLEWLTVKSEVIEKLSCEGLTSMLSDRLDSWFYWNSCRPIKDEKWFTFFVTRLEWENYFYEKHYYLTDREYYVVQELEKWTWVTSENIKDKNYALKENNEDYSEIEAADKLVAELLK